MLGSALIGRRHKVSEFNDLQNVEKPKTEKCNSTMGLNLIQSYWTFINEFSFRLFAARSREKKGIHRGGATW